MVYINFLLASYKQWLKETNNNYVYDKESKMIFDKIFKEIMNNEELTAMDKIGYLDLLKSIIKEQ